MKRRVQTGLIESDVVTIRINYSTHLERIKKYRASCHGASEEVAFKHGTLVEHGRAVESVTLGLTKLTQGIMLIIVNRKPKVWRHVGIKELSIRTRPYRCERRDFMLQEDRPGVVAMTYFKLNVVAQVFLHLLGWNVRMGSQEGCIDFAVLRVETKLESTLTKPRYHTPSPEIGCNA